MSRNSKCLLFLLQRCVAGTRIQTRSCASLPGWCGVIQHRAWTPAARTLCLQRVGGLQSAVKSSQYSFCTKAEEPCEEEYPPLPAYQLDSDSEKKIYIVQVKGLPWSCSAEDLLNFFSDCRICDGVNGIHLHVNKQGKLSGRAFIEMEHEEDVSKALEKHRQYLGPRYVEVYEVSSSDTEVFGPSVKAEAPSEDWVVRLRGLPFSCTEDDVSQFFSGLDIVENGVTIVTNQAGRNSGGGFVRFSSQEAFAGALQRDRQVIGDRYIEVFPSRSDEIHSQKRTRSSSQTMYEVSSSDAEVFLNAEAPPEDWVVRLRGLPFSCTEDDVSQFFSGLDIVENGVTIVTNQAGRNSGGGFVRFSSQEAFAGALQRDRQVIGDRYIEVFPSRSDEIHSQKRTRSSSQTRDPLTSTVQHHFIHMRGLPFQATGEDIVKFFSPLVVSKILLECGRDGKIKGEADVYFRSHKDAVAAMSKDRKYIGGRYIELFLNSPPEVEC